MPDEQRDGGQITGRPLLDSSAGGRIDRYNELLGKLAASRPVTILHWAKYSIPVDEDLALWGDGVHLGEDGTAKVLDDFMWADIQKDSLARR